MVCDETLGTVITCDGCELAVLQLKETVEMMEGKRAAQVRDHGQGLGAAILNVEQRMPTVHIERQELKRDLAHRFSSQPEHDRRCPKDTAVLGSVRGCYELPQIN